MKRLIGGASKETWSFDAEYIDNGTPKQRGFILRSAEAGVYGDATGDSPHHEYHIYKNLGDVDDLCVPKGLAFYDGTGSIATSFFIMDRIDHCESSISRLYTDDYQSVARKIVEQVFALGGRLATYEWETSPLKDHLAHVSPDTCALDQLENWASAIESNPNPENALTRGVLNWLRKNPPKPPERVALLSGDFRLGNFLFNTCGEVNAWLDWEMGHLGDPLEDLSWGLMPLWHKPEGFPGGISEAEIISIWESNSGIKVDPRSLKWWRLFQHVKSSSLWQASVVANSTDEHLGLVSLSVAYLCPTLQNHFLLNDLGV